MASTYFGEHLPKRQYDELSEMYELSDPWGAKILTQALMRRAVTDVQRIIQIRDEKPSLQNLVRSGVVGEAMLENITAAENELEKECQEIIVEADLYRDGWGKSILNEAGQFLQMQNQQKAQQMAQAQAAQAAQQQQPATVSGTKAKHSHSHGHGDAGAHSHSHDHVEENPNITEIDGDEDEEVPELLSQEELQARADRAAAELLAEEEASVKKAGGGKKNNKGGKKK